MYKKTGSSYFILLHRVEKMNGRVDWRVVVGWWVSGRRVVGGLWEDCGQVVGGLWEGSGKVYEGGGKMV